MATYRYTTKLEIVDEPVRIAYIPPKVEKKSPEVEPSEDECYEGCAIIILVAFSACVGIYQLISNLFQ